MSYNNHDNGDPNKVRYAKKEPVFTDEELQIGCAIKIYGEAKTKSFREFKQWMLDRYQVTIK